MRWCDLVLSRALELSNVNLFGASHVDSVAVSEQAVCLQYDFALFRAADVVTLGLGHEETMLQRGFFSARRARSVTYYQTAHIGLCGCDQITPVEVKYLNGRTALNTPRS